MQIIIAIDGACRDNGKPNCVAGAGVVVLNRQSDTTQQIMDFELFSTNQRGEILALITALKYCTANHFEDDIQIVTDSAYLLNTIVKEWYRGWRANGWQTREGNDVKNQELWKEAVALYEALVSRREASINMYHIKGHVIPVGEVTAMALVDKDPTGTALYKHCLDKYDALRVTKADKIAYAQVVSEEINGFKLPDGILREFVALNCTADIIANVAVNTRTNTMANIALAEN